MRLGNSSKKTGSRTLAALFLASAAGSALVYPAIASAQTRAAAHSFNIPAKSLNDALTDFGRQSGLQVSVDANDIRGIRSQGVSGNLAPSDALTRLLAGTGFTFRVAGRIVTLEKAPQIAEGTIQLGTLRIEGAGGAASSSRGDNGRTAAWDGAAASVYVTPGSVSVITKETLDAYPAQSPADMLRGATGVISGEARTSGGLDVNIRGLQGQGRVPVTVDGAINGTTVYRGYQGTSNRSFVDPDFISHIAIEKGPSNSNAIAGGIGGSITMTTLGVDDILTNGESVGLRVKASLSNNSTEPGSNMNRTLIEPKNYYGNEPLAATRERNRPGFLTPAGGSASLAFARRGEVVDILAGYSFRRTGNYHAGAQGEYAPRETHTPSPFCAAGPIDNELAQLCDRAVAFYDKYGSTPFAGGEEVYNTSTDTESVLVKAVIRPADDHALELGYGGYWSSFGENYPGSLSSESASVYQNNILSRTSLDRVTARYRWNPNNEAIDLKINGWLSKLKESAPSLANSNTTQRYVDSWGADLTNSSRLSTPLGLFSADYGASFLYEEAGPVEKWTDGIAPGREGVRDEVSIFSQMALEPALWLQLNAGVRYQHYTLDDRQSYPSQYTEALKRSEGAFSFSLGAAVMPIDGLQIFANYKQAARLPSLMEATSGFFYNANPDLHKEEAHNWEFGVNYNRTNLLSDGDELGLKLVWFDNDIDDYIARRFASNLAMEMFNTDRARFRGLEGDINYKTGGFNIAAGATYYDRIQFCRTEGAGCINSSLASDFATNYIPPQWSANVAVNQKFLNDRAMLGARLTYMGKRGIGAEKPASGWMPLISEIKWHPYILVDTTGSFKINEMLTLNWSIDNLLDRYYNEPMGLGYVPAPGRTFRIGFTGTLGSKNGEWPGSWFSATSDSDPVNWTGPYIGVNLGYGFGSTKGTVTNSAGYAADIDNDSRFEAKPRNMLGGLHAGFNYQLPNDVVLGLEGDFSSGNMASWSGVLLTGGGYNIESNRREGKLESDTRYQWDRLITLRGRLGYSMGQTLVYGTGGIGWMRETQTRNQYRSGYAGNDEMEGISNNIEHYFYETDRKTRSGLVVGGGVERALGKNWSIRAEYNYAHFGKKQFDFAKARKGVGLNYWYQEIVGYEDIPGQTIIFDDGEIFEIPPAYDVPITEFREATGTSNIIEGRTHRGDAGLHSVRIGISYRF